MDLFDRGVVSEEIQKVWWLLGANGLSVPAQSQAARGFVASAPELLRSTELESFASVDLDSLEKADAEIRAAVNGDGKLSNSYSAPPDVAASIAANELNKRKDPDPATRLRFSNEFKNVWGTSAEQELQIRLFRSRQISKDNAIEKDLEFAVAKPQ
jgi:hypothetical protein